MLAVLTIAAFILIVAASLGCIVYVIMGSWIAALIAGVSIAVIIEVCSIAAFAICRFTKKKSKKLKQ